MQMVKFPVWTPDCDSLSPVSVFWILSSDASSRSTVAFSSLGNSDHVVVLISIDFPSNSKGDAPFHGYSCVDWGGLHDRLTDFSWEDIFQLSASAAGTEYYEWVQVGIDVYIPHC